VLRDLFGNEARDILDETMETVRDLHAKYIATLAAQFLQGIAGLKTDPDEAGKILQQMRLAKATIRGDRAEYEKATAELRSTFEMVGSFVLQAALAEVLGPIAGVIFRVGRGAEAIAVGARVAEAAEAAEALAVEARIAAWAREASVGVASTMASNKIIYGSDYSWSMIKHDLATGFAGAIGQAGAAKLAQAVVTPVAAGLARVVSGQAGAEFLQAARTLGSAEARAPLAAKVISKVRDETVSLVGNIGSLALTDDVDLQNVVRTIVMGKGSEALRKAIRKVGMQPERPSAVRTDEPLRAATAEDLSPEGIVGRTPVPVSMQAERPTVPTGELALPEAPEPISLHLPEPEAIAPAGGDGGKKRAAYQPSAHMTSSPPSPLRLPEGPSVPWISRLILTIPSRLGISTKSLSRPIPIERSRYSITTRSTNGPWCRAVPRRSIRSKGCACSDGTRQCRGTVTRSGPRGVLPNPTYSRAAPASTSIWCAASPTRGSPRPGRSGTPSMWLPQGARIARGFSIRGKRVFGRSIIRPRASAVAAAAFHSLRGISTAFGSRAGSILSPKSEVKPPALRFHIRPAANIEPILEARMTSYRLSIRTAWSS
jgi:hypothetical protein